MLVCNELCLQTPVCCSSRMMVQCYEDMVASCMHYSNKLLLNKTTYFNERDFVIRML